METLASDTSEASDTDDAQKLLPKRISYRETFTLMKKYHRVKAQRKLEEAEQRAKCLHLVRTHIKESPSVLPEPYGMSVKGLHALDMALDPNAEAAFQRSRLSRTATENFCLPFTPTKPLAPGQKRVESRLRLQVPPGGAVSNTSVRERTSVSSKSGKKEKNMDRPSQVSMFTTSVTSVMSGLTPTKSTKGCTAPKRPRKITFKISDRVEELTSDGPITVQWLNERLASSCRACRFELPMDMCSLEKMTSQEYLLKYCKISRHKMNVYKKIYNTHKNKQTNTMSVRELESTLSTLLVDTVEQEDIKKLIKALRFENKYAQIDCPLFAVICAVAERICYLSYIERYGKLCGLGREYLECADFSSLSWKLAGVQVDSSLKTILYSLG